jgi:DNA polymerase III delta prime subunit
MHIPNSQLRSQPIHPRLNQIVIPLLSTINDEDIRERLKKFIVEYNSELVADRGLSWESDIIFAILKLEYEGFNAEITVNEIAKAVNEQIDEKEENLTARKVGWYLRKRLQLKPYRRNRGYVLSFKTNRKKLDFWKERYGITDADIRGEEVHDVNDVNVTQLPEVATVQKLNF